LNIADITDPTNTEGALIAATFAAQGYIVVAPNYAGYDISTLGYHPFLNAAQQSGEMINILAAARTALPKTLTSATSDNGQLFVTGYSEGGHVAMATQRALQAAGAPPTAAAPMSGPYALEAFGDAIFFGNVNLGSTVFGPLLTASYQHAYGNIYASPADVYSPRTPPASRPCCRARRLLPRCSARPAAAKRSIQQHDADRDHPRSTGTVRAVDGGLGRAQRPGQSLDAAVCGRVRLSVPHQQ